MCKGLYMAGLCGEGLARASPASDPNNNMQGPGRGAQGQLGVSRPRAAEVLTPEPVGGMSFGNRVSADDGVTVRMLGWP